MSALDVVSETCDPLLWLSLRVQPELLVHTMQHARGPRRSSYEGISLAIISFVGLESISQAAQETQRPASVIPRTSTALILTILIFALSYSNLALGMQHLAPDPARRARSPSSCSGNARQQRQQRQGGRRARGREVPYFGAIAAFYVPVLGAILLLISSNSGVFGSSRIAYAMTSGGLLPSVFQRVHQTLPHTDDLDRSSSPVSR